MATSPQNGVRASSAELALTPFVLVLAGLGVLGFGVAITLAPAAVLGGVEGVAERSRGISDT